MFRAFLYVIGFLFAITILRTVIGAIGKLFGDFAGPQPQRAETAEPPARPRPASSSPPESLKKDPVCGTFIAPSSSVSKTVGGTTYYFCSVACRDQFQG